MFSLDGTQAKEKGLSALNYKDISVDVEIKGMNYEIGSYTAADLVATVNLDDVTKEGTYDLDIDVKSSHSTGQGNCSFCQPLTLFLWSLTDLPQRLSHSPQKPRS